MSNPTRSEPTPSIRRLFELVGARGFLRTKEAVLEGFHPQTLARLVDQGRLWRIYRGVYALPEQELTTHHTLAIVCTLVPKGVICLLSALQFHELTTQSPSEVWVALPSHWPKPKLRYPSLQVINVRPRYQSLGAATATIAGREVRVTTPARTVVDCFRFRHRVGDDVALEALKAALGAGVTTPHEILDLARRSDAEALLRPYLEVLS